MCHLIQEHNTIYKAILQGKIEKLIHNLIKPLNPTVSLREIQRTEEHVKLYHGDAISKIQTGKLQD